MNHFLYQLRLLHAKVSFSFGQQSIQDRVLTNSDQEIKESAPLIPIIVDGKLKVEVCRVGVELGGIMQS
jgi:hypothetical protein